VFISKRRVGRTASALFACALLGVSCTSASVGGQETLDQVDKATTLQLETTLRNAAAAQETFRANTGSYTTNPNVLQSEGLNVPPEVTLSIVSGDPTTFCMEATHTRAAGVTWHVVTGGAPESGSC
jgi:hypothetical protein